MGICFPSFHSVNVDNLSVPKGPTNFSLTIIVMGCKYLLPLDAGMCVCETVLPVKDEIIIS